MSQVQGQVTQIDSSRTGVNKFGKPWTLHKAQVNGQWISFGFDRPVFSVGQTISFDTEPGQGGKGTNAVKGSVRVVEGGSTPPPQQATSGAVIGSTIDSRQQSIVMQHSQEMAARHVATLLANEALPLSSATAKGGTAKRQAEIDAVVNKYTVQFYNDAVTGRLLKFVADTLPSAKADGAIPVKKEETSGDDDLGGDDDGQ